MLQESTAWENTWVILSLVSLVVLPWTLGDPSGSTGSPPSSTSGASRQSSSDRDSGRNFGDVDRNHTSAWAWPIREHREEPGSTSPWGTVRGSPILRGGRVFTVRNESNLHGPLRDTNWSGSVPNLHDSDRNPGRRLQWRVEICPPFGSNSPGLERHLRQRRDVSLGVRKSMRHLSIKSGD